ncbi:MAG: hypothetical protein ACK481_03460 [Candidatus Melainabacteria bacterium]|jgi:hypothetical protein
MNILERESAKALYTLFNSLTQAAQEAFIIEFSQKVLDKKALIQNGKVTLIQTDYEIDNKQSEEEALNNDLDEEEVGSGD